MFLSVPILEIEMGRAAKHRNRLEVIIYQLKNVSNERWAFSILIDVIQARERGYSWSESGGSGWDGDGKGDGDGDVGFTTRDAEEAALRLGMARGTGRAALSVLKALGVIRRVGRGRWSVKAVVIRASWAGEALEKLAGVEDEELAEARRTFLRAAYFGWLDEEERDQVRQITQAAFRGLWGGIRLRSGGPPGIIVLKFEDVGAIKKDREGIRALARYLARSLAWACAVVQL